MSKVTTHELTRLRDRWEKVAFVTAYDYPTAHFAVPFWRPPDVTP